MSWIPMTDIGQLVSLCGLYMRMPYRKAKWLNTLCQVIGHPRYVATSVRGKDVIGT